jgi:hypothetical protein
MLPAWATVVLAIGGALIGAVAGVTGSYFGYRSAKLNLAHQEREAWRAALIEAVQNNSDAWSTYGFYVLQVSIGSRVFDQTARLEAEALVLPLGQSVTRLKLLFGSDSRAGEAAGDFDKKFSTLAAAVSGAKMPWDYADATRIGELLDIADAAHTNLLREAHQVIRPVSWQR